MGSPYQYPWVKFSAIPTEAIDSDPVMIYGATHATIIDSIFVCNRTNNDVYIDLYRTAEREDGDTFKVTTTYRQEKFLLPPYASAELLSPTHPDQREVDVVLVMEGGDLLYANTDYAGNVVDCEISGRRLLEDP